MWFLNIVTFGSGKLLMIKTQLIVRKNMVANEVNELPCAFRVRKVVAAMCVAGMMASPLVNAQDNTNAQNNEEEDVENIVVTGVFSAKSLEQAPVALSVVSGEELEQQIPSSASDILKNVPGVFVNSALGEIRNVVFSRGVSANSLDGASGYYYVSMQENSVPVELMTTNNYGPDYFSRPDLMLDHVESLRGGTASVRRTLPAIHPRPRSNQYRSGRRCCLVGISTIKNCPPVPARRRTGALAGYFHASRGMVERVWGQHGLY